MTKKRKSLDDALAQQFVYGEGQDESVPAQEPAPKPTPPESSPKQSDASKAKPSRKSTLMDKLQTSPKEVTVRFTVDLPASMHQKLSILAARTGKKKAEIVRVLLDDALKDVEE